MPKLPGKKTRAPGSAPPTDPPPEDEREGQADGGPPCTASSVAGDEGPIAEPGGPGEWTHGPSAPDEPSTTATSAVTAPPINLAD
jgi:hypothetical protein